MKQENSNNNFGWILIFISLIGWILTTAYFGWNIKAVTKTKAWIDLFCMIMFFIGYLNIKKRNNVEEQIEQ